MKLTKVRRIEGDVNALRNDLRAALGLDEKEVTINQLTRQIIVKVCYSWIVRFMVFVVGLGSNLRPGAQETRDREILEGPVVGSRNMGRIPKETRPLVQKSMDR